MSGGRGSSRGSRRTSPTTPGQGSTWEHDYDRDEDDDDGVDENDNDDMKTRLLIMGPSIPENPMKEIGGSFADQ